MGVRILPFLPSQDEGEALLSSMVHVWEFSEVVLIFPSQSKGEALGKEEPQGSHCLSLWLDEQWGPFFSLMLSTCLFLCSLQNALREQGAFSRTGNAEEKLPNTLCHINHYWPMQ